MKANFVLVGNLPLSCQFPSTKDKTITTILTFIGNRKIGLFAAYLMNIFLDKSFFFFLANVDTVRDRTVISVRKSTSLQ